jgi:transcriptional regulator with XRE-family HTH domain
MRRRVMAEQATEGERNRHAEEVQALARRLRESREYLGLSQEIVAEYLGVPRASVSAMEAGKRKVSSMELRDLARLYRTSVEHLLGEEPEEDPVVGALYRTAKDLNREDREQVLRFAEFLRAAGAAPGPEGA